MMIIDDANLIDQVNPFLTEQLPGTWSRPYDFSDKEGVPTNEIAQWDSDETSPGCESGPVGTDNRSRGYFALCEPGEPNCPMRRNLEPTQRVDPDIKYPNDPGNVPADAIHGVPKQKQKSMVPLLVLLIIMSLVFIAAAKL